MLDLAISSFVTFFVVIDPLGMVPLFTSLVPGMDAAARRKTALRGTLAASGILVVSPCSAASRGTTAARHAAQGPSTPW